MTAAQAPTPAEGTGKILNKPAIHTTRRVRRTNLLSDLTLPERQAFLQEQLDQSYLFRQLCALSHGLPEPGKPNIINSVMTDEEITQAAEKQGVSPEEVRRREELAAREALLAMQEKLMKEAGGNANNIDWGKFLKSKKFWTPAKAAVAGITGTGAAAAIAAALLWPADDTPDTPAPPQPEKAVVDNDAQTLLLLQAKGLAAPRTPLGEKVQEAFEKNPKLRETIMQQIEDTLLNDDGKQ